MARSTPKRAGRAHLPGSRFPSEAVASNVRKRRQLRDLTQEALAARMSALGHEWTAGIVGFVERGDRAVTVDELVGLAVALEVSVGDLLDPSGPDRRDELGLDFGGSEAIPVVHARAWVRSRSTARSTWGADGQPGEITVRTDDAEAAEAWFADLAGRQRNTTKEEP